MANATNQSGKGIKARFAHPSMSGDGIGSYLGRFRNAVFDGQVARADLHLSATAEETPDGNLAAYVLSLAEKDPAAFGASIVFSYDLTAMEAFEREHTGDKGFYSPEPANVNNYEHARLSQLYAADVVDEPAANPSGLFHHTPVPRAADALLDYALGRGPKPALAALSIDPDRLRGYVSRALASRGLAIVSTKDKPMKLNDTAAPATEAEPQTAVETTETTPPVDPTPAPVGEPEIDETEPATSESSPALSATPTAAQFLSRWGIDGAVWFAQGKTWEQAEQLHAEAQQSRIRELEAENQRLRQQAQNRRGASSPLSASLPAETHKTAPGQKPGTPLEGLALAAASIRLPGKKYDD
ncbi:MAG: hypothetical protein EHM42_11780 [Planctomycetaceae bacterium]|nr:MAG: hypothetical protein EHM42_11780 [Planctomycetaceae bacterium]